MAVLAICSITAHSAFRLVFQPLMKSVPAGHRRVRDRFDGREGGRCIQLPLLAAVRIRHDQAQ
eukprot:6080567-Pleurochrysis_carterae.AAC.2